MDLMKQVKVAADAAGDKLHQPKLIQDIDAGSVTRISNIGPNTNMNIFVIQILTKYEYRIYSYK